jgi:TP901 family phage tail tape measure protein
VAVQTAVIVNLVADASGVAVGVAQAKKSLAGLSGAVAIGAADSLAGMRQVGYGMQTIGNDMTRFVTVPVAAAFYGIVKTFSEYEKQMKHVQAITGATGTEFEKLGQKAQDLGLKTQFSAAQVAEGMGILGQAGFTTGQILDTIPTILNLAAAGSLDLATAADVAVSSMYGFGFSVKDLPRVVDGLSAAAIATNTNIANLGHAFKYAGPLSNIAGLQFEEAAAALGLFSNAGIDASMAGTTLRGALTRMLNPPKEAAALMQQLGVNVVDADGRLISLKNTIDEFNRVQATPGQLMEIFGQRPSAGMIALMGMGSDELEKMQKLLESSEGSVARIAEIKMQGLAGDMTRLKSAAQGFAIAFAEAGGIDLFIKAIQLLTAGFRRLAEMNPNVLKAVGAVLGLLALGGPLLIFVSRVFLATVRLRGAVRMMSALGGNWTKFAGLLARGAGLIRAAFAAMLGPWGLVVAAIAAAAYGLYLLYQRSEKFRNIVGGVIDIVKGQFVAAFEYGKDAIAAFVDGFNYAHKDVKSSGFIGVMQHVGQKLRYAYDQFQLLRYAFMQGFKGTGATSSGLYGLFYRIGEIAQATRQRIIKLVDTVRPKMEEAYQSAKPFIEKLQELAGRNIVISLGVIVGLIVLLVAAFVVALAIIGAVIAALVAVGVWVADKGVTAVQDFIDKWKKAEGAVGDFKRLAILAIDDVREKLGRLGEKVASVFDVIVAKVLGDDDKKLKNVGTKSGNDLGQGFVDGFEDAVVPGPPRVLIGFFDFFRSLQGIYNDFQMEAAYWWLQHGETVSQIVGQSWDSLVLIVEGAWAIIKGLFDAAFATFLFLLDVFSFTITGDWRALWDSFLAYTEELAYIILGVVGMFLESVIEWLEKTTRRWDDELRAWVFAVANKIYQFGEAGRQLAVAIVDGIKDGLRGLGSILYDALVMPFVKAFGLINKAAGWIGGFLFGGHVANTGPAQVIADPTGQAPVLPEFGGPAAQPSDPWMRPESFFRRSHNGGIIPGRYMADVPMLMQAGEGVIPVGAMADVLTAARRINSGGAPGNNYSIEVNVAPGTNPTDVGRQIVEAITQYERRNGKSWRAA